MLYKFFVYLFVTVTSVPWDSFLSNNNVPQHSIEKKAPVNKLPQWKTSGIIQDGVSLDFKNGQHPWRFMSGINGQASLKIESNHDNPLRYARFETHGLQLNIENDNPYSPRDYALFESEKSEVQVKWFRRYCLKMEVRPEKATTQFNITALWSDNKENIQNEFNILRIYTKDKNGEGTCNDRGATHKNAVCIEKENAAGQKVWSVIEKQMYPKTAFITVEVKMFKDSDFALANISLTDCSINPDEHERPSWASDGDTPNKHISYRGNHGTYFSGNIKEEERKWKEIREQQAATAPPPKAISIQPTKQPIAWTTQKTHQKQIAQTHHQANYAPTSTPVPAHLTRPTIRPTTRPTTTTRSTTRPTLPSDWGLQPPAFPSSESGYVPFLLDETSTTEQSTAETTTQSKPSNKKKSGKKKYLGNSSSPISMSFLLFIALLIL